VAGPEKQGRTEILGTIKVVARCSVKEKYLDAGNEREGAVRPHLVRKAGGSLTSLPKTGGLVPHKVFGERVCPQCVRTAVLDACALLAWEKEGSHFCTNVASVKGHRSMKDM
jgi:hypothetical protein